MDANVSIGVTVLNTSGGNYDNTSYKNIKFTSSGTSTSQKWSGASKVKLSATNGYCYAYYPYNNSASTITAIPVTAGGTDYMYATRVNVNDKSKNAPLTMKHALSAIRFALKKGTYSGTGNVTAVSVSSDALGSSGTLDATTGGVTATNKGTVVSQSANFKLSGAVQNVDVVVVPSGSAGTISLSVTIDGKVYSTSVSFTTIAQGYCYTYTITVNAGELSLSSVKVGGWGYNTAGTPTITAGGYTVTLEGDISEIAFCNELSGSTLKIVAVNQNEYIPAEVSYSGQATLTQSVDDIARVITVSSIQSDVSIYFNGVDRNPPAIADDWSGLSDGVYLVRTDLKPANITVHPKQNNCAIGVGLVDATTGQKLMIEKFEDANDSYKTLKVTEYYWGYFNWTINELLGITDYPTYQYANSSYEYGYITNKKGEYSSYMTEDGYKLGSVSDWPTDATKYVLADQDGFKHTQYLKQAPTNDGYGAPKIRQLLESFLNSTDALGYDDWYVPACRQLALFYVYLTDINIALTSIGGTPLCTTNSTSSSYWASSESRADCGWIVNMRKGYVRATPKNNYYPVRLARDL